LTALVRAETSFRAHFLLRATLAIPQLPRNRRFPLRQLPFPLVFLTEAAVTLALRVKDGRFLRSFGFLLL
jgi:hypothetical protein